MLDLPKGMLDDILEISPTAATHLKGGQGFKPVEPFVGVRSTDEVFLENTFTLTATLNTALPKSKTVNGFYEGDAIPDNWQSLLTVAGEESINIPYPQPAKKLETIIKEEGLSHPGEDVYEAMLDSSRFFFSSFSAQSNFPIKSGTNVGYPTLSSEKNLKKELLLHFLGDADYRNQILNLASKSDTKGLVNAGIYPFYKNWYRNQPNKAKYVDNLGNEELLTVPSMRNIRKALKKGILHVESKVRYGYSWEGRRQALGIVYVPSPMHLRNRTRLVFGGSWAVNAPLQILFSGFQKGTKKRHPIYTSMRTLYR